MDDPLDGSLAVHLDNLERTMRQQSDMAIRRALELAVCRLAGLSKAETIAKLGWSPTQYTDAWRRLKDALRDGADQPPHAAL